MTHHSSPRPSSQCHLRTAFYYVARRQTSVGMFVAKPPLNLEGHATAIQLWKACLVETRHSAASAPCTSSLYPSTPPQAPPVPLEPLSPSYEAALSKACQACAVLTVCSLQLWMVVFLRSWRESLQKKQHHTQKCMQANCKPLEAYPEMICGCSTLANRSFCLAGCPHIPPFTYQTVIKHDR